MLIVIAILSLSAWASAENQTDQYYPNCDLVAVSHVYIQKNENGTLDIEFSWDRKMENYDRLDGPVTQYVVRHGPLVDEQPTNQSQIMRVASDHDFVTLRNVTPCDKYFIQVCAVSNSFRFLFQQDVWDHAWRGSMGLGYYKDEKTVSETVPAPVPAAEQSFSPECDLVQTSYVSVGADQATRTLTYRFSWDKKESSYKTIGAFDHYLVRHGPVDGGVINETKARYVPVDNDTSSFHLTGIQPGNIYGLQICAVFDDNLSIEPLRDWNRTAWLGTLDLTRTFEQFSSWSPEYDTGPVSSESKGAADVTGPIPFLPICDLVQTSYVSTGADEATKTLTVRFSWDKKESSYKTLGAFNHYLVRHGPVAGGVIEESQARYMPVENDTSSFLLTNIQPGSIYGLQICAIFGEDFGIEPLRDWDRTAWLGTMDLTGSFEQFGLWSPEYSDSDTGSVSDDNGAVGITGPKSFVPKCDLVEIGAANVLTQGGNELAVSFRWKKKQSSYDRVGFFEFYLVRYGPWRKGEGIVASTEQYNTQGKGFDDTAENIFLLDVPPNGDLGVQICAILNVTAEDEHSIDWSQAWTGVMTIASYESYDESHRATRDVEITKDSTPVFIPPRPRADPRCDLVETTNVTAVVDQESKTLTVSFSWEKKTSSYNETGPFDHYLIRHGPVGFIEEVKETEARYLILDNDTEQVTLIGVPLRGLYGVSICAILTDDIGINQDIDWVDQPSPLMLDFHINDEDVDGTAAVPAEIPDGQDSHENTDSDNSVTDDWRPDPVVVTEIRMGTNYGIVLVVLAIVSIITTLGACLWLFLVRKRRSAKKAALLQA